MAWGAGYGQGFHLGRPASFSSGPIADFPARVRLRARESLGDIIDAHARAEADLALLGSLTNQLLDFAAATTNEQLTIVVAFHHPCLCTDEVVEKLRPLAAKHPYVKVIDAPEGIFAPADGVRIAQRDPGADASGCIAVIGQRFYCALLGRPIGAVSAPAPHDRWTYSFTVDPAVVLAAAYTVIVQSRSVPPDPPQRDPDFR